MGLFNSLKEKADKALQMAQQGLEQMNGQQSTYQQSPQQTTGVQQGMVSQYNGQGQNDQTQGYQQQTPPMPSQQAAPGSIPPPMPGQQPAGTQDNGQQLYDSRLERLIDAALADGVLTEKEKQVLFKRAEAMGYDLDEFEMVLDAKLYDKTHSQQQQTVQTAAPKSDKYGDVRKCPNCGAIVETYTAICPSCGYAFHNVGNVSSFEALSKKLNEIDSKRTVLSIYAGLLGGGVEAKQANIINNFPVPTAKDDILEFLTMAQPLAIRPGMLSFKDNGQTSPIIGRAWYNKCKQVIFKSRIALKDDKKAMAQIEEIAKQLKIK